MADENQKTSPSKLRSLIGENKLVEALDYFIQIHFKDIESTLLKRQLTEVENLRSKDLISYFEYGQGKARISNSLLELIDNFEHDLNLKSPEDLDMHIFVLTGNKNKIKENLTELFDDFFEERYSNEEVYCKLLEGRYSDEDLGKWKPFLNSDGGNTIDELLFSITKNHGYVFKWQCFNNVNDNRALLEEIGDAVVSGTAIAIIDILAIDEKNKDIAIRFDFNITKSTLIPICSNLEGKLRDYMNKKQKEIFKYLNIKLSHPYCYFRRSAYQEDFTQELLNIFSNFKIIRKFSDVPIYRKYSTNLR